MKRNNTTSNKGETRNRYFRKVTAIILSGILISGCCIPSTLAFADDGQPGAAASQDGGTPPDKPSGEGGGEGGGGEAPGGDMGGGAGGGGGANTQTFDYSGTYTGALTADGESVTSSDAVTATDASQNALLAQNAGAITYSNGTITKSGDVSDGDSCNFYGVNSIVLSVGEGSNIAISDTDISADSEGSNGLFATDSGTIWANNDTITTTSDNSRGMDATYGGTIVANQMTISTQGDHCATVANDRGGGNVSVTNSTLSTAGSGSPILYSTGCIEVNNITGSASGSQIAGMEGLNTILINNSSLTSTITSATASDPVANGVIIYQSTSGDADTSTGEGAVFQAVDSTLSSSIQSGTMFYVTNTTGKVLLKNTTLDFDTSKANLLTVEGNDSNNWGSAGSNGGTLTFVAEQENLTGNISVDTISALTLDLVDGSTLDGAISITENANGAIDGENVVVNVDGTSSWIVSGDSTVDELNVAEGGTVVDEEGNTVTIVAGGETVVEGTSDVTVTVNNSYSTTLPDTVSDDATLTETSIERTGFDTQFGTDTAWSTSDSAEEEEVVEEETTEPETTTTETVEVTPTEDTTTTADDSSNNTPLVVGIAAVAALIAAAGAYLGISRKRKNGQANAASEADPADSQDE